MFIMNLHDQTVGLLIFFPVLCTITLGLRLFVRLRLCKNAFGWDDVALVTTWVGFMVWVAFAWLAIKLGFRQEGFERYFDPMQYICNVISGVVKISVALVLYRLDTRLFIRVILIVDMIICAVWTIVVSLLLGLGCTSSSPYRLTKSVCHASKFAQESSYIMFNGLHVLIPVVILWGVKVNGNLKWAVISLFSVGLVAAVAAMMKLRVCIEWYNPTPTTDHRVLWYRAMLWAATEHGLSLFAASILAIRPFFTYLFKSYTSLTSKHGGGGSSSSGARGSRSSSHRWSGLVRSNTHLEGRIGVRSDVDVHSEYGVSRSPAYTVDVYGDDDASTVGILPLSSRTTTTTTTTTGKAQFQIDDGEVVR